MTIKKRLIMKNRSQRYKKIDLGLHMNSNILNKNRVSVYSRSQLCAQLGNDLQKYFCTFCFDNGYFKRFHRLIF